MGMNRSPTTTLESMLTSFSSLTPVHFFSQGSTMMLGEQSESADYWKIAGNEALLNGIKGVVMMGAHWDATGDAVEVAMNPTPGRSPVAYVHPSKYVDYKLEANLPTGERCMRMLKAEGFDVRANDKLEWIHDTYLILIRMFPEKCPPTTLISMNARFDPHFHMRIGCTLRSLRKEGYLIIGTGGAVHNLFRNKWEPMLKYRDNFAQETPPEKWALEFRQSVEDCMSNNRGPALRRAITRLMKHPQYRDAHATDDHFMAACFVAGAAGNWEDEKEEKGRLLAETWELTNMCNSQSTIESWDGGRSVAAHRGISWIMDITLNDHDTIPSSEHSFGVSSSGPVPAPSHREADATPPPEAARSLLSLVSTLGPSRTSTLTIYGSRAIAQITLAGWRQP